MLEAALAAGVAAAGRRRAARRRPADARRAAAHRQLRLRPRGGHLRLAQPVRATTGSSSSAATASSSPTRPRRAIEARLDDPPTGTRDRPRRRAARHAGGLPARPAHALRGPRPERPSGSCSTAPTAPPTRSRPEIFRRLGAHVTVVADAARRAQHQRRRRLHPRRRAATSTTTTSPSPSTATATASSPRTARAPSSTATSCSPSPRCTAGAEGVAVTVMTNFGFHAAMREAGDRGRDHAGRRPLRPRGAAREGLGARRRAVRPPHRHGLRARRGDGIAAALLTLEALGRAATSPSARRWRSCPSGS